MPAYRIVAELALGLQLDVSSRQSFSLKYFVRNQQLIQTPPFCSMYPGW
jgi:hypothetical protein